MENKFFDQRLQELAAKHSIADVQGFTDDLKVAIIQALFNSETTSEIQELADNFFYSEIDSEDLVMHYVQHLDETFAIDSYTHSLADSIIFGNDINHSDGL